ncbi:putative sporulation protein YtxC [Proteinivorax hydrogeniformans]|uniref:Sporulation protein YtxC n=1 Tax=Proteinivorax hydrogeniformans TaxID=1826727 RepID=A0AAU8HRG7_9FIRM
MESLTIGTERFIDQFRSCLNQNMLEPLRREGIGVEISEDSDGNTTFMGCTILKDELTPLQQEKVFEKLSWALADYIVEVLEKNLVEKLIKGSYSHLKEKEQNKLYLKSLKVIKEFDDLHDRKDESKKDISKQILDHLLSQPQINIEGFLRFRLKSYFGKLENFIEQAADELKLEKEYNDFIRLLKYFVNVQQPQEKEVHLLKKDGYYLLNDSNNKIMTKESCLELFGGDGIISSLVTNSPLKVFVHIKDFYSGEELLRTVNSIFEDRIVICLGCTICEDCEHTPKKGEKG